MSHKLAAKLRARKPQKAREVTMGLGETGAFRRIVPAFPNKLRPYYGPRASALSERIAYGDASWFYGHIPPKVQNLIYASGMGSPNI